MTNREKILIAILVVLIIAGIVVTAFLGLNKGTEYKEMNKVEFYLAKDVDFDNIRQITDRVFGNQKVLLQKVEYFNDRVLIVTEKITQEQLNQLINEMNQEYDLNYSENSIDIITIPGLNLIDEVYPYIVPIIITLLIVLAYMAIRFKKQGVIKVVFTTLFWVALILDIYYSIIAITRIPVNRYSMALAAGIMLITLTSVLYKYEKKSEIEF